MGNKLVKCGKLSISNSNPYTLIAGPCQLENEQHAINVAGKLKEITQKLKVIKTRQKMRRVAKHIYRSAKEDFP